MKKTILIISIAIMVLGCHKKEVKLNLLKGYLEKAQDKTLSLEQRVDFNNKALDLAQQINDTLSIAKVYKYTGLCYLDKQIHDSAYLYYLKAEKYYTLANDKENIGKILLTKSSIQYYDGNLSQAEIFCLEALKVFNTIETKSQIQRDLYDAYNLLGVIADDQKQYNKAIDYYDKAFYVIEKEAIIKNKNLLKANYLNNLGVAYRNKNENKKALSYFTQALNNKDLSKNAPHLYAMLLDNTAYSRFKLKDYAAIDTLFQKALQIREKLNLVSGIIMSKLHMSEYYQQQKNTQKTFQLASEAYDLTKTKKTDPRDVMRLLKQLQQVNEPLKEIYAIEYKHISDSLLQVTPKIHETITQELAQAEAKEEAKAQIKERIKTALIEFGLIVCFLGVNYVINQREKRRVRQSEEQSAKKQDELESQIKIYDLALKQKNNGTGNHYFVDMIHDLLHEQIKSMTINEYIDDRIAWDDLDNTFIMRFYNIIEECFEMINQYENLKILNLEIFQGEEKKDDIIFNIEFNRILEFNKLQKIISSTKKIGGKIKINNQEGENTKIGLILETRLSVINELVII